MRYLFLFATILFSSLGFSQGYTVTYEPIMVEGINSTLTIKASKYSELSDSVNLNGIQQEIFWKQNEAIIEFEAQPGSQDLFIGQDFYPSEAHAIPAFWSIFPPLVAIALALVFKEVLSALFTGIISGAFIIACYSEGIFSAFSAIFKALSHYVIKALEDGGHLSVIVFSVIIGGVVHIISANGGMAAIVARIAKRAVNPKSGQMATYLLGFSIFFDDYANTLVVGNTMRPISDRLRISREKLAYIVDSTAAPVAAIAFVTTWIGAELGYISEALNNSEMAHEVVNQNSAYAIFFQSLPYSFYPLLTLVFMFMLIKMGKDFGPMAQFELKARKGIHEYNDYDLKEEEQNASKAYLALIPILTIVLGTIIGLLITGYDPYVWQSDDSFAMKLSSTIGAADSYKALLWSSLASFMVAIALSTFSGRMTFSKSIETGIEGFKTMISAVLILTLAWSLALVTEDMHTAEFLSGILEGHVAAQWFPAITFVLGAVVAFSTGSSWGTMALLYPLLLPALISVGIGQGLEPLAIYPLFLNATAGVLAGSVLGDHCSPISDTTILSSLSTKCNHIAHVNTQMPYALTVGSVALLFGIIPSSFGISSWICLPVCIAILYLIIKKMGTNTSQ